MAQPRICNLIKMKAPVQADRGYLDASGATVPTNGTDGYQTGCIFRHTDGTAESSLYVNEGSVTSCAFVPLLTTSNEVQDLPDFGPMVYTAGAILQADGDSYEEVVNVALPKTGSLKIGDWVAAAATTGGVALTNARDVYGDGQIDVLQAHGVSTTSVGSDHSAKVGRFRHLVNMSGTMETETYGLVGQLVVKTATLGHYHAGLLGTVESNTAMVVGNTLASTAGVTGRPGGSGITVSASCILAGVSALSNTTSITQTGKYVGLLVDTCSPGTTDAFGIGVYVPMGGATQGLRLGDFDSAAATTNAIPFATAQNFWADGQLDTLAVFGSSASNLGSGYSAKCGRYRHIVSAASATVEHETYGLVGQLVVKDTTLGHLHSGILGTFEGHTSGVVVNGGYTVGAACITARLGGHAAITATDPIAGFLAFNNGAANLAGGNSCAFATSMTSASYPWTYGLYIPAGSATRGIVVESVPTSYLLPSMSVGIYGTPLVDSVLVDNIAFSANLSTATNKTSGDTSTMAAYIGVSNTAATTNNKLQGVLASCSVGYNCYDAYAVQGHTTIGIGGVSTQNANAHLTGVSGKAVLTGAVGQGWVTGVLAIVEGAGAVTGLCHVIAGQLEATATDSVCDALLFLGADALATNAIEVLDVAHVTNLLKLNASSGCLLSNDINPHAAPDGDALHADKVLRITVDSTPYYIPIYDTLVT
jgi:hypothetical protein